VETRAFNLPTQRSEPFKKPAQLLSELHKEFVAGSYFAMGDSPDHGSVVSWADDFTSDLERAYELLQDASALFAEIDLKAISSPLIGIAGTNAMEQPENEQQRHFVDSFKVATRFCDSGSLSLDFCCFVLCEAAAFLKDELGEFAGGRHDLSTAARAVEESLVSVPTILLKDKPQPATVLSVPRLYKGSSPIL
jgi:hypothetical protein